MSFTTKILKKERKIKINTDVIQNIQNFEMMRKQSNSEL